MQACSITACLAIDQSILFQSLVFVYSLVGQRALGFDLRLSFVNTLHSLSIFAFLNSYRFDFNCCLYEDLSVSA